VTVQLPAAGIVPPVSTTAVEPLLPVTVPPQVVLPGAETVIPLGNASTKGADNVPAILLALLRVRVSVELPPAVTLAGLKDFLSDGTTMGVTVKVATAAATLLPLLVVRAPPARELT
jgi:hypothetical protein